MEQEKYYIKKEDFIEKSKMPIRIMPTEAAMYEEIADIMISTIKSNNESGKTTTIICPVGPIGQYPIFAERVNREKVSLKKCTFINMDEYLNDDDTFVDYGGGLSFHEIMDRLLYNKIDKDLVMPESQRMFPVPGKESEIDAFLAEREVDCCLTGVGINGHIAFNEPPETDITDEAFGKIGTRCLDIARETITNNGRNKLKGALDIFPKRCITLGMKQLLNAKAFKIYLYCDWQWGIMRKVALGEVSKNVPASYLQRHPNAEMVISQDLYDTEL